MDEIHESHNGGAIAERRRFTRRGLLKAGVSAAAAAALPAGVMAAAFSGQSSHEANSDSSRSKPPAKNPRWYGFNLLEYFSTDADWMKYFPYKNDGMFPEDDFRWIRDWGFNWVRLPMDYRF
jgi:aryl-phospho-beta-D-glucosidase BglC (GH1 family)